MQVLSVSEFLSLVNETLALIPSDDLCVEGEVSDYRVSQQKWVTFTLKDETAEAVVPCFGTTYGITTPLQDGMRVRVFGNGRVYERFGKFSLNVRVVEPVGEGALKLAYEALKKRLEAEGLFQSARKRSLPRFPKRVGVITSREAAAYTDFLRIANNRWGGVSINLCAVHVQGAKAVEEILEAFARFNALDEDVRPDVLVLTRGGGSLEDLHAFNSEEVARAVFGSSIPVVVGVGHERDESLADFVADVRASTPSNAAEIIFSNREAVLAEVVRSTDHIEHRLRFLLEAHGATIVRAGHTVALFFERISHGLSDRTDRFARAFTELVLHRRADVDRMERLLRQVDPKRVLARGYSIVTTGGALVTDAGKLEVRAEVRVQLARGGFDATIDEIIP